MDEWVAWCMLILGLASLWLLFLWRLAEHEARYWRGRAQYYQDVYYDHLCRHCMLGPDDDLELSDDMVPRRPL